DDQSHPVGPAGFLERPAHAKVAHEALRERRDPAKRGEGQRAHEEFPCLRTNDSKDSSTWFQPTPWLCRDSFEENGSWRNVSSVRSSCDSKVTVTSVSESCPTSPLCHWNVKTMRDGGTISR